MKSSKIRSIMAAILAVLMICMTAVACDGGTTDEETSADSVENKTEPPTTTGGQETEASTQGGTVAEKNYTVKFMDGDKVIQETKAASGDLVDIPADLQNDDPRIIFKGWTGLDDSDYQAGKVEVFGTDLTFNANWYEMFGSTNEYTAKQTSASITLDGDKDAAYDAATAIDVSTAIAGTPGATAKAYILWDASHYYLFVEVTDSTYNPFVSGNSVESNDGVEIRMDLLHSDALAPGYTGGWGGSYRGDPGPMVEAGFKIGAGVALPEGQRFGDGAEAYWEWWSNHIKENGNSKGVSKATDTGYTVEYVIEVFTDFTDEAYRPHDGQVIGFGMQVFDKTADGNGTVAIEAINADMNADARNLSNIKLVK